MFRKITLAIALALITSACSQNSEVPNDPKKVLNAYISKSFAVKGAADRAELVALLTRDAKARLSAWSDEQFRQAFIDNKREFVKLVFTESKNSSPTETYITYELTYVDQNKGSGAKVTQKKMAQLIQDDGKWMISDVQSIKEMVEYKNEMALP
jgi:hypothetical protein